MVLILPALAIQTPDRCMYPECDSAAPDVPMVFLCDGGEESAVIIVCTLHEQAINLLGDLKFSFIRPVVVSPTANAAHEG